MDKYNIFGKLYKGNHSLQGVINWDLTPVSISGKSFKILYKHFLLIGIILYYILQES